MAKVIIFGVQDFASLAHYYLENDSGHEVVAFSVTKNYMGSNTEFEGHPIISFENIEKVFPPEKYKMFIPMSHRKMNFFRKSIFEKSKLKGYRFINYISSKATIFNNTVFGENCLILENNTIQPFTKIGNNVVMWSGNHIGHHSTICDHVFFSSHVVLSGHCFVEPCCFFGVNATIRDNLRLSEGSLIGMSACVTQNTEAWGVYMGIPAKKKKVSSKEIEI
jgi:sugar O-acyltransferase (sialic acid O-acetyltransferase NeuD family)